MQEWLSQVDPDLILGADIVRIVYEQCFAGYSWK